MKSVFIHIAAFLAVAIYYLPLQGNTRADEIQQLLVKGCHDTTRARLLNEWAWEVKFSDPAKAEVMAVEATRLAIKYNLDRERSNAYKTRAHTAIGRKNFVLCMVYYDSALYFARRSGDQYLVAECLNKKAGAYGDLGDFDRAIEYYSQGLVIAQKLNSGILLSKFYNNLADAYQNTGRNTRLVQQYYELALKYSIQEGNWAAAGLNSSNLAKEYSSRKLYGQASAELIRTFDLLKKTEYGTYLYAATCREAASVMVDLGKYKSALAHARLAYRILDSLKMPINILRPLEVLADVSIRMSNLEEGNRYADEMLKLAISTKSKVYIKEAYRFLATIAKMKGDYRLTVDYLENYKAWSDSVFKLEREQNISRIELQSALAKQELELKYGSKLKERENLQLAEDNRKLKLRIAATVFAILVLLLLGFLLFRSIRRSNAVNKDLIEKNALIRNYVTEKDVLIQEIHHRVKNNLTLLQSLFYLQSKNADNEVLKEMLQESQARLLSMSLVHQHLYENGHDGSLELTEYIEELLRDIAETFTSENHKPVALYVTGDQAEMGVKLAIPLGLILNELITNSLKYAFTGKSDGEIRVQVKHGPDYLQISYQDNGPGLPEGISLETEAGFGFKIIRLLSRQIKAEIQYNRAGEWPVFEIRFPV